MLIDLYLQGRFDLDAFVSETIGLDDVEAAFDAVSKAGGIIAKAIFSFPGGRRFHFIDPSGSELAVWQAVE